MNQLIHDGWLSEQLGMPSYQWKPNLDALLDGQTFQALEPLRQGRCFAFAKLSPTAHTYRVALQEQGFYLADTALVFEKPIQADRALRGNIQVRWAAPSDAEGAIRVAQHNFIYDRFHADPHIPPDTADALKAAWVSNYFRGQRGDQMVIAEKDGQVVGFNQLLFRDHLVIDLIATDQAHRRQGIAHDLIAFAEAQAGTFSRIRVGTQASNIASVRLYEAMGFRLVETQYVFHYYQAS